MFINLDNPIVERKTKTVYRDGDKISDCNVLWRGKWREIDNDYRVSFAMMTMSCCNYFTLTYIILKIYYATLNCTLQIDYPYCI